MLMADLKNQTVPQACATPPAAGRQARCGPGNNGPAAKRENWPGWRQQHACHITAQTSHSALPARPGSSPDLELFGAAHDAYIQVHGSSAVQITMQQEGELLIPCQK